MVEFSKKLMEKLRVKMEGKIKHIQVDMTSSVTELSNEMNRQFQLAEKRHRQMQDKVSAVEHKLDSGMAGLNGKIAGLEEQLKRATDAQAATLAQLQAEIRGARAESSGGPIRMGMRMGTDWRPSGPGNPSRDDRYPFAQEKYSTGERVEMSVGVSRPQPRRAVGAAFRPYYTMLTQHGYTKDKIIQRYIQDDGTWKNIVLLAQKGGRAADLGRFTFAFDGLRAYVASFTPGSAAETLPKVVEDLGRQVQGETPAA